MAFALRIYRLPVQSVWVDEGYSVDFASRGAAEMLNMWQAKRGFGEARPIGTIANRDFALAVDIHPPLFYFSLHYWILGAGTTEFSIRYLPLVSGVLVVALVFALGARLFGRGVGALAALVAALAPFYVAYSQEARMYMPVTLFSIASTYWMARTLGIGRCTRRSQPGWHRLAPWAAYVLTAAAALYTHYSAFLVLGFQNLWVLFMILWPQRGQLLSPVTRRSLRLACRWAIAQLSLLAVFAPWLGTALGQVNQYSVSLWTPNWQRELGETLLAFGWGGAIPLEPLAPPLAWISRAIGALALLGLVPWLRRPTRRPALFALGCLGLSMALALALFQLRPMFHPRYLMPLTPPYYLLLALGLAGLWRLRRWAVAPLAGLLLAACAYGNAEYQFNPDTFKDDTRSVAAYLVARTGPQDVIFLDAPEPLSYYYHGPAPMFFIPGNERDTARVLTELARGHRRAFFLQWFQAGTDPLHVVPYLLEKYGRQVDSRGFHGYRLREYLLPEGARYTLAGDPPFTPNRSVNFDNLFALERAAYGGGALGLPERLPAVDRPETVGGGKLWVQLGWRLLRPVSQRYKAFVYLRDAQGHLVGQDDLELDRDRFGTDRWPVDGAVVNNYYVVPVEPAIPPGEYQLEAGLYQAGQVQRLSRLDANGSPAGSTAVVGTVLVIASSPPGEQAPAPPMARRVDRDVAPGLRLLGDDPPAERVIQGERAQLTLFWQAGPTPSPRPLTTQLTLQREGGVPVALPPRAPGSPAYPTDRWRPGEVLRDWQDFDVPAALPPGRYTLSLTAQEPTGREVGAAVSLAQLQVVERDRRFEAPPIAHPVEAVLTDAAGQPAIRLLGYDLGPETLRPGAPLHVTLYWQAEREQRQSYTAFVHLLDEKRLVAGQVDHIPGDGASPTSAWAPGEVVVDRYEVPLKPGAAAGDYTLEVGMYLPETGKRLAARATGVRVVGDGLWLQQVKVAR